MEKKSNACHLTIVLGVSGFPCGSADKESTCNAKDLGSVPGFGISPGEGKGHPPIPGEFHGLYSPQNRKESDTTEQLSLSLGVLQ